MRRFIVCLFAGIGDPSAGFVPSVDNSRGIHRTDGGGILFMDPMPTDQLELDPILIAISEQPIPSPDPTEWMQMQETLTVNLFPQSTTPLVVPAIFRGIQTAVFQLPDPLSEYVIKYHRFCPGEMLYDPIDPVVVEAFFLANINARAPEITNRFLFLSGAIDDPLVGGKLEPRTIPCPTTPKVRYMISEKVVVSLDDFAGNMKGGVLDVVSALKLGIKMVNIIEKLHSYNIIHGDAHWGNFAFASDERLVLIDFGRAQLIGADADQDAAHHVSTYFNNGDYMGFVYPAISQGRLVQCHSLISQWESRYFKPSYRDDVQRILIGIQLMIFGSRWLDVLKRICDGISQYQAASDWRIYTRWSDQYLTLKETGNMFDFDSPDFEGGRRPLPSIDAERFNFVKSLPKSTTAENMRKAKERFAAVTKLVRNTKIRTKPDYEGIILIFSEIIALVEGQG